MSNASDVHKEHPEQTEQADLTDPNWGRSPGANFYDTQQLRALGAGEQQAELLVLSRDEALIDVVRRAAPGIVRVSDAPDLDRAVAMLPGVDFGVLVVDVSTAVDLAVMLPQLTQHFPEIVVVVAGKREQVSSLMNLTAAGRIFRFLLIPLAQGQTRLALGAAIAQHLGMKAANLRTGGYIATTSANSRYLTTYGVLGVGLLLTIAVIWFGVRAFTEKPATPVSATVVQPAALPTQPDPVQAEIALANEAFAQGKYVAPAGESALDLYRSALNIDPGSSAAQAGIRSVVDKIVERAEQALTAERIDEATQGLEQARGIDPAHPRLQFLDVQIARERERVSLDQARDASNRVRKLVEQANRYVEQQRFTRPAGGNARDALIQARKLGPDDIVVVQAIRGFGAVLTEAARKAVAAGDMAQARDLIDAAAVLGFSDSALVAVERSMSEASTAGAAARSGEAARTAATEANRRSTARAVEVPASAAGNTTGSTSGSTVEPEKSAPAASTDTRVITEKPAAAGAAVAPPSPNEVLQAATLVRTREVAPDYPTQAAMDGLDGWVDIDFTISEAGVPEDLKVWDASPKRVFDRAAIASLRQWRFEPIKVNGVPTRRRATIRVRFQRQ